MDHLFETNLKSVVGKLSTQFGVCIDLILDPTLKFSAACTLRERHDGKRPVILINLRRINALDEVVIAHVVSHEYGHVLRGHLCQLFSFPLIFNGTHAPARTILELQADEFAAHFVCNNYENVAPVVKHIGHDSRRKELFLKIYHSHHGTRFKDPVEVVPPKEGLLALIAKRFSWDSDGDTAATDDRSLESDDSP